jgi:hypothetical protein
MIINQPIDVDKLKEVACKSYSLHSQMIIETGD